MNLFLIKQPLGPFTLLICLKSTRARVVNPDSNSKDFDIIAAVLQGDTLAKFLFIIVLNDVDAQSIFK